MTIVLMKKGQHVFATRQYPDDIPGLRKSAIASIVPDAVRAMAVTTELIEVLFSR